METLHYICVCFAMFLPIDFISFAYNNFLFLIIYYLLILFVDLVVLIFSIFDLIVVYSSSCALLFVFVIHLLVLWCPLLVGFLLFIIYWLLS